MIKTQNNALLFYLQLFERNFRFDATQYHPENALKHCHVSQKYSKTGNIYLRQQIRSTYHPVIGVFVG